MKILNSLQKKLNYKFKNLDLLVTSLSHRSLGPGSNERLEFLGDSILSYIISVELYKRYPDLQEGALSRIRASLVNGEILAELAKKLAINEALLLGPAELKSGGRDRQSILADALEAIIGAIYWDAGIEVCQTTVLTWFEFYLNQRSRSTLPKDPKSALQEWAQAEKYPLPVYQVDSVGGAAHNQTFQMICEIEGLPHKTSGAARTRRQAEQKAAEAFLKIVIGENR